MDKETKVLFFDTETSGFISKDKTFDDPAQAWTVQIGAILATPDATVAQMNQIIQANGREMNYHAEQIHGISVEMADREGRPEVEVAEEFGRLLRRADLIVCHNYDFDWAYVYQMLQRNMDSLSDEARSAFYLDTPSFCTMKDKTIIRWVGAKNKAGRIKWPKLIELYNKVREVYEIENGSAWDYSFTEDDAHDAYADIECTKRCFFELLNMGIINPNLNPVIVETGLDE